MYSNESLNTGKHECYPVIDKIRTGSRIRQLMREKSLTVKDIKEYLALASVQGIYLWLNGSTIPSIDNLYALSELFQVPMDEIVCGSRKPIGETADIAGKMQFAKRLEKYYRKIQGGHAA